LEVNPTTSAGDDRWLHLEKDTDIRRLDGWMDFATASLSISHTPHLLLLGVNGKTERSC
jgi:hypothetical protein